MVLLSFLILTNYASYFELVLAFKCKLNKIIYLYKTEKHFYTDYYQVRTKFMAEKSKEGNEDTFHGKTVNIKDKDVTLRPRANLESKWNLIRRTY